VNIAQAALRCFDYGAFGVIAATANLPFLEAGPVFARLEGLPPENNPCQDDIPTDKQPTGGNKVADAWDGTYGAKPGDWDEDNIPQTGDNAPAPHDNFKGDGYPYYEEYRGLEVDGGWTEMDPNTKEVFVCDLDDKPGATGYYGASDLTVYISHTESEMTDDNVVNTFRDTANNPGHLADDQHGLRLVDVSDDPIYNAYYGYAEPDTNDPGPPRTRTRICINHDLIMTDWSTQLKVNHTIAHELGHGSNLWHHGDSHGWWGNHVTGAAVALEPVPLPATPFLNHYADRVTTIPYDADPYDGDDCIMQYLRPIGMAIPAAYCTTPGAGCLGIPNTNHEQCLWHIDVRDAPR